MAPPAAEKKKDSSKPSGKFSLGFGFEKKEESKIEETLGSFYCFLDYFTLNFEAKYESVYRFTKKSSHIKKF